MATLITTKNCKKCEIVKPLAHKIGVKVLDFEEPEAQAELGFLDLLGRPLSAPILLLSDGSYIEGDILKINKELEKAFNDETGL